MYICVWKRSMELLLSPCSGEEMESSNDPPLSSCMLILAVSSHLCFPQTIVAHGERHNDIDRRDRYLTDHSFSTSLDRQACAAASSTIRSHTALTKRHHPTSTTDSGPPFPSSLLVESAGLPLPPRADSTPSPSTCRLYTHLGTGRTLPRQPGLCSLRAACDDRRRARPYQDSWCISS